MTNNDTDDESREIENSDAEDIHPLPVFDDVKNYGPLAEVFERIKRPVIFGKDLLRECAQRLSDAIGDRPGKATLEMEETGREAEIGVVEIGGLKGGSLKLKGISRRLKITVEKGADGAADLVINDESGAPYTIPYEQLVLLLLNELQAKDAEIEAMQATVEDLLERVEKLEGKELSGA